MRGTVSALERHLLRDGFLQRYTMSERTEAVDPLTNAAPAAPHSDLPREVSRPSLAAKLAVCNGLGRAAMGSADRVVMGTGGRPEGCS